MLNIKYLLHTRSFPGYLGAVYACGDGRQERFFRAQAFRRKDITYPSGTFWRGMLPRHSCLGGAESPAETFRYGIQSRSGILCPCGPSQAGWRMLSFSETASVLWPWIAGTKAGNDVFLCFINELNNHPPLIILHDTPSSYRRKPVSQAIDSCVCGPRPRLSPG